MFYGIDTGLSMLLFVAGVVVVLFAQFRISSAYSKYKKTPFHKNLTGSDVARMILEKNGLDKVYVVETNGELSDHYNPSSKTVKLSPDIYRGQTIAAISVAAHEVGHAIQDKENYTFMRVRSMLVPFVNLVSYLGYFSIIVSIFAGVTGYLTLGIGILLVTILFQLVTLPVEFDASKRAKAELEACGIINSDERKGVDKMLNAAAFTYVASLLSSLLNLLRLVIILNDRNGRD